MPLFQHQGHSIHYLVRGRGEALLLLHGLGSSGADWAYQVRALEGRFRVVVPDLPGCGHSGSPGSGDNIESYAATLWRLVDHLQIRRTNIAGLSMGGAVALEMALQRPAAVPRLVLINSLASYRVDDWRKWLEARLSSAAVRLLGMHLTGRLCAARMFPHRWQHLLRDRAAAVIGAVSPGSYLASMAALEQWTAIERLAGLCSRTLVIAAEFDYTPLTQKYALAASLGADIAVIRGSRHGTPFDAALITNELLIAHFSDKTLPSAHQCLCDPANELQPLEFAGSLAEQHALGACVQFMQSAPL